MKIKAYIQREFSRAVYKNQLWKAKLFYYLGASVHETVNINKDFAPQYGARTPLMLACLNREPEEMIWWLLKKKADPNDCITADDCYWDSVNIKGTTALAQVVMYEEAENLDSVVQLLINNRADPYFSYKPGQSAYEIGKEKPNFDAFGMILWYQSMKSSCFPANVFSNIWKGKAI